MTDPKEVIATKEEKRRLAVRVRLGETMGPRVTILGTGGKGGHSRGGIAQSGYWPAEQFGCVTMQYQFRVLGRLISRWQEPLWKGKRLYEGGDDPKWVAQLLEYLEQ